jgi:hypothetical protein
VNKHTGEQSAPLIKPMLIELFASGWKGEFRDLRKKVNEQLGHQIHPTFIFRPLMELQRDRVVHCSPLTGHWQLATVSCSNCGGVRGKDQVDCWCGH